MSAEDTVKVAASLEIIADLVGVVIVYLAWSKYRNIPGGRGTVAARAAWYSPRLKKVQHLEESIGYGLSEATQRVIWAPPSQYTVLEMRGDALGNAHTLGSRA